MVKIKNLKKRLRSFNLETVFFKEQKGNNGVGKPETLTILPRTIIEVPKEILDCEEIKQAIKSINGNRPTLRVL